MRLLILALALAVSTASAQQDVPFATLEQSVSPGPRGITGHYVLRTERDALAVGFPAGQFAGPFGLFGQPTIDWANRTVIAVYAGPRVRNRLEVMITRITHDASTQPPLTTVHVSLRTGTPPPWASFMPHHVVEIPDLPGEVRFVSPLPQRTYAWAMLRDPVEVPGLLEPAVATLQAYPDGELSVERTHPVLGSLTLTAQATPDELRELEAQVRRAKLSELANGPQDLPPFPYSSHLQIQSAVPGMSTSIWVAREHFSGEAWRLAPLVELLREILRRTLAEHTAQSLTGMVRLGPRGTLLEVGGQTYAIADPQTARDLVAFAGESIAAVGSLQGTSVHLAHLSNPRRFAAAAVARAPQGQLVLPVLGQNRVVEVGPLANLLLPEAGKRVVVEGLLHTHPGGAQTVRLTRVHARSTETHTLRSQGQLSGYVRWREGVWASPGTNPLYAWVTAQHGEGDLPLRVLQWAQPVPSGLSGSLTSTP